MPITFYAFLETADCQIAFQTGRRYSMKIRKLALFAIITAIGLATSAYAKQWETDFKRASSKAERTGKYMLVFFSGSDWCGWCKKLDKEVFRTNHFKNYADKNLVCVLVDFPRKKSQRKKIKKQNQELAGKYDVEGYPSLFLLSPEGDLVAKTGYMPGGAKKFVQQLRGTINQHNEK
jgi:thioredoxin-related protein